MSGHFGSIVVLCFKRWKRGQKSINLMGEDAKTWPQ